MCLKCKSGTLEFIDSSTNSKLCITCPQRILNCVSCKWVRGIDNEDFSMEEYRYVESFQMFSIVKSLKSLFIACDTCDSNSRITLDAQCVLCRNVVENCEKCVLFDEDSSKLIAYEDVIEMKKTLKIPKTVITLCYQCKTINETSIYRFALKPSYKECSQCPSPTDSDSITALKCVYIHKTKDSIFAPAESFNLIQYLNDKADSENYFIQAEVCPPSSCLNLQKNFCILAAKFPKCLQCGFKNEINAETSQ